MPVAHTTRALLGRHPGLFVQPFPDVPVPHPTPADGRPARRAGLRAVATAQDA